MYEMYKVTVKGKGFNNYKRAYHDGRVNLNDDVYVGLFRRKHKFYDKEAVYGESEIPLRILSTGLYFVIGNVIGEKKWKVRHKKELISKERENELRKKSI
jgi:hypothetical protein